MEGYDNAQDITGDAVFYKEAPLDDTGSTAGVHEIADALDLASPPQFMVDVEVPAPAVDVAAFEERRRAHRAEMEDFAPEAIDDSDDDRVLAGDEPVSAAKLCAHIEAAPDFVQLPEASLPLGTDIHVEQKGTFVFKLPGQPAAIGRGRTIYDDIRVLNGREVERALLPQLSHELWLRFLHKLVLPFVVYAIALVHEIHQAIKEARAPKKAPGKGPKEGETIDVFVPRAAGPLVETPVSKDPLLLTQVPIRSTKADAKREALAYARARTGNPALQWKKARQLINQWGREERAMAPEYAEKMRELTEASA